MSLPPGFLDELRARLPLSQVVGRAVVWDMRKSNMAKGDWWAPCPFHQERTASFHVDDRKGFYYCFGCHAKGDALSFLKETGNMGFLDAVEALAREAGMVMPARDPEAAAKADRQTQLVAVVEAAVQVYRLQLRTAAAQAARDYLDRRRLTAATLDRWEIGFAPDARQFLIGALGAKGIPLEMLEAAGLAARADDGTFYDRFRGRILFPIRDARGRAVSFGGRAMDPNARAKYLNGPETELFDKGRTLYNVAPAREAAGKGQPLIVAEGYMDVIALVDAGFGAAVAPLGTAVTGDQLHLMWRIDPEPVIALDGDAAGLRAAMRLIDLSLPLLEGGRGLRFALLPDGQDPDDLIRARGAAAMQGVLDRAEPMVSLLWRRETDGKVLDSPERRAALDVALRNATVRIPDPGLRSHYEAALKDLKWALFNTRRPTATAGRGVLPGRWPRPTAVPALPAAATRASALVGADDAAQETLIEAVLLATLAAHPALLPEFEADLEAIGLAGRDHDALRHALLVGQVTGDAQQVLETLLALAHVRSAPSVRPEADLAMVRLCLAEGFAKLDARRGARAEISEAMADMDGLVDEGLTWRLTQVAAARHRAEAQRLAEAPETGEDSAALSRRLQEMLDGEIWIKRRR